MEKRLSKSQLKEEKEIQDMMQQFEAIRYREYLKLKQEFVRISSLKSDDCFQSLVYKIEALRIANQGLMQYTDISDWGDEICDATSDVLEAYEAFREEVILENIETLQDIIEEE